MFFNYYNAESNKNRPDLNNPVPIRVPKLSAEKGNITNSYGDIAVQFLFLQDLVSLHRQWVS